MSPAGATRITPPQPLLSLSGSSGGSPSAGFEGTDARHAGCMLGVEDVVGEQPARGSGAKVSVVDIRSGLGHEPAAVSAGHDPRDVDDAAVSEAGFCTDQSLGRK